MQFSDNPDMKFLDTGKDPKVQPKFSKTPPSGLRVYTD